MLRILYPQKYVDSLFDVDPEFLRRNGIKGILFDLDNTIVCRDAARCTPEVEAWLSELQRLGFRIGIVSNNSAGRVGSFAGLLGIPAVHRAVKPWKKPFLRAVKMLGTTPGETALIGDQIFTDVLGGNMAGLYTILVAPLKGKEFWGTRLISRPLERIVLAMFERHAGRTGRDWKKPQVKD